MKIVFVTTSSFNGLPPAAQIFNLLAPDNHTIVIQNLLQNSTNYFDGADEIFIIEKRDETNSKPQDQSIKNKIVKYIKGGYYLFKTTKSKNNNEPTLIYSFDVFIIGLAILTKKYFKRNLKLIYHQFEVLDLTKCSRIERIFFKILKRNSDLIDLFLIPEINRLKLFEELLNHKILESKKLVLPNTNSNIIEYEQEQKDKITIGHVGSTDLLHYLENAMNQLAQLPKDKYQILFIGRLSSESLGFIKKYNLPNLEIIGQVPHKELENYYKKIDIGLILYKATSVDTKFCAPNKLYEYWSYGIHVIAHHLPGLVPVFKNKLQGDLIDFEQDDFLINAIESYSKDYLKRKQAINYFVENESLQVYQNKLVSRIEKIYNE